MYKVWRCIESEAYTSRLSGTPACPAEILHCFFFARHFWKWIESGDMILSCAVSWNMSLTAVVSYGKEQMFLDIHCLQACRTLTQDTVDLLRTNAVSSRQDTELRLKVWTVQSTSCVHILCGQFHRQNCKMFTVTTVLPLSQLLCCTLFHILVVQSDQTVNCCRVTMQDVHQHTNK